jgi:exopolysaccharide biosynthesis polyprenyl glycosylphosphotransferase
MSSLNVLPPQPTTGWEETRRDHMLQPRRPVADSDTDRGTGEHAALAEAPTARSTRRTRRRMRPFADAKSLARRGSRRRRYALTRALIDGTALVFAAVMSAVGAQAAGTDLPTFGWLLAQMAMTIIFLSARGTYRFRLQVSPLESLRGVIGPVATATVAVLLLRVLTDPGGREPAGETVRMWAFMTGYLLMMRTAYGIATYRADRRGLHTLIVGAGTVGQRMAQRLLDRPHIGLRPIGFLDKEPRELAGRAAELEVLGASWDLEAVVRDQRVDHVLVTFSSAPMDVMLSLVRRCRELGVEISLVPRLFEEVSTHVSVEHLGGVALLRIDQSDPRGWQYEVKYAIDRIVGALLSLLALPLMLVLALAVRLSSRGPIFFRQPRIGLDGQVFDMLKFRTMRVAPPGVENDALWAARALGKTGAPAPAAVPLEDRTTRIGDLLRRWSLDELPQLLNVARGEMSLVGPRPERTGYVAAFENHVYRYGDRHRVKSGLTGWAQVNGLRGETSLEDRIEWDNWYVENWSPMLDLRILLLTIPAVLSGTGTKAQKP